MEKAQPKIDVSVRIKENCMTQKMDNEINEKEGLMENEAVTIKTVDPDTAAMVLGARAAEINEIIKSLDETKVVTQETLQIEFSV
jgi:hypothetical protein